MHQCHLHNPTRLIRSILSVISLLLISHNIFAQVVSQSELMQKASSQNGARFIVQLNADTQAEGILVLPNRIATQRNIIHGKQDRVVNSLRRFSTQKIKKFRYLPYISAKINKEGLQELLANPDVAAVFEDTLARPSLLSSGSVIGVPGAVSQGYTG